MATSVIMPTIGQILESVRGRGLFDGIRRRACGCDIQAAMDLVRAIGELRRGDFVIDGENRFAYENIVRWCHGDPEFRCLDPASREPVRGDLAKGIYIAGNTGTGKTWCLDIMLAYCSSYGFQVLFPGDSHPRTLAWRNANVADICDYYAANGETGPYRRERMLAVQDFGSEAQESVYMGNRSDVMRQLVEYRGNMSGRVITLFTSNMSLAGEALRIRYGDRVVSRLHEMCNYFEMTGKDRRRA